MRKEQPSILLHWETPPNAPAMEMPIDEVHVWLASIDHHAAKLESLFAALSPEELARGGRHKLEADRNRFVIGRGLLRRLLGHYLRRAPGDVKFGHGPFGKPALQDKSRLEFNVAHSGDLILFAFAKRRSVGIDIERINPELNALDVAAEFCSLSEMQELTRLNELERRQAMFRLWVRKEAFLKATGEGLSRSPLEINVLDGLRFSGKKEDECAPSWQLRDLEIDPDYAAAIAIDGDHTTLRGWNADELAP